MQGVSESKAFISLHVVMQPFLVVNHAVLPQQNFVELFCMPQKINWSTQSLRHTRSARWDGQVGYRRCRRAPQANRIQNGSVNQPITTMVSITIETA